MQSQDISLLTPAIDIADNTDLSGQGFVLTNIQMVNNGDRSSAEEFDAPESDPPNIMRAAASQHYYTDQDIQVPFASMMIPISGTYKVNEIITAGKPKISSRYVACRDVWIASGWSEVAFDGNTITLPNDGFIVAHIYGTKLGDQGVIYGYQHINGKDDLLAAASQQINFRKKPITGGYPETFIPSNSFCLPVQKDTSYKLVGELQGQSTAKAYFASVNSSFKILEPIPVKPNEIYQAENDGFLVALIGKTTSGDRGIVQLYTGPNAEFKEALASTSFHDYVDLSIPLNSSTIPVTKGNFYSTVFKQTSGNKAMQAKAWFYPIS